MKKKNLEEVWSDGAGTIAILTDDGTYRVYVDPETVTISVQGNDRTLLSDQPWFQNLIIDVKTSILNQKEPKK